MRTDQLGNQRSMTNYRRNFVPGGSYFFTVNLADRRSRLLIDHIVLLPDHLHAVWTLPDGDPDFSLRWRLIKSTFSRALPPGEQVSASRAGRGERGIWQRRYWEHTLRDEADFARHVDYIHFNPVKHGHAQRVREWPYSSFQRMVRLGVYPEDWAGDIRDDGSDFGER